MEETFKISFNYIVPLNQTILRRFYQNFLKMEYTDKIGYGFRDVSLHSNTYLSAILVKRIPTFIYEFNKISYQMEKREIFFYIEVSFALDSRFNLLEIYGPVKYNPKVRSVLKPHFGKNMELSSINLAPFKIIPKFTSVRLKIKDSA